MGTKTFNPSFVFFSQRIGESNKAVYVYLEKDEKGMTMITFALIKKNDNGDKEIADSYTAVIEADTRTKPFVTSEANPVFALGDDMTGVLFLMVDELKGTWKIQISSETEFGNTMVEEIDFTISLPWLPF